MFFAQENMVSQPWPVWVAALILLAGFVLIVFVAKSTLAEDPPSPVRRGVKKGPPVVPKQDPYSRRVNLPARTRIIQ